MAAERAGAGHATEQPEHMARDGVEPGASFELFLNVGQHRLRHGLGRGEWRWLAEQQRIDFQEAPWLLVGGAAHHHTVDVIEMRQRLLETRDAAVEYNGQGWMPGLQPID